MAQEKAEEMSDVIGRLRSYESGEYGLREAVAEVQELRRTARRRDDEQGRLVQEANTLQEQLGGLLQENEELRQQLGLGPREAGRSAGPAGSDQLIAKVWFGF
jgi:centrosomal protein CEP290